MCLQTARRHTRRAALHDAIDRGSPWRNDKRAGLAGDAAIHINWGSFVWIVRFGIPVVDLFLNLPESAVKTHTQPEIQRKALRHMKVVLNVGLKGFVPQIVFW